jgi:hypothetical protein
MLEAKIIDALPLHHSFDHVLNLIDNIHLSSEQFYTLLEIKLKARYEYLDDIL